MDWLVIKCWWSFAWIFRLSHCFSTSNWRIYLQPKKKKAGLVSFKKKNISKPCSYREIFHVYFPDFQSTLWKPVVTVCVSACMNMLNRLCPAKLICLLVFGNIHLWCSALACIYIGSSVFIYLFYDNFRWEQSTYSCDIHYRLFIIINSLNVIVPACPQICVPQFSWCAYRVSGVLFFLEW